MNRPFLAAASVVWVLGFGSTAQAQLSIVIHPESGLSSNSEALAAFNQAAAAWTSVISTATPVTITIDANLTASGFSSPDIIGQTGTSGYITDYTNIKNQLQTASRVNGGDALLPTAYTATLPTGFSLNTDTSGSFGHAGDVIIQGTSATFKALGFTGINPTYDGTITFNSAFSFAYTPSELNSDTVDFQTVATHEIGHVLGFDSVVDTIDVDENGGTTQAVDPNVLDLYRFSSATQSAVGFNFATAPRDLTPGSADVTADDAGNRYAMSTGYYKGDGRQASHWKDDALNGGQTIGIMDPTLANNTRESITSADIEAMRLMGYTAALPEPHASLLLFSGLILVLPGRRRRLRKRNHCPRAITT